MTGALLKPELRQTRHSLYILPGFTMRRSQGNGTKCMRSWRTQSALSPANRLCVLPAFIVQPKPEMMSVQRRPFPGSHP